MKKIIIANWKMNPKTSKEAKNLAQNIERGAKNASKIEVVLAPPFPFIESVAKVVKKSKIGAQDVFWENPQAGGGAYTGQVSMNQLKSLGVKYIIVGHSERRVLGETEEMINKKLKTILKAGVKAVLCVGERERHHDEVFPLMVRDEIYGALLGIKKPLLKNLIVTYEPIWAISTEKNGKPATPKNVFEISILIRKELFHLFGKKIALQIPILYGGSVNEKNATLFVSDGRVDGLLVGGASLNTKSFVKIIDTVAHI